MVLVSLRLLVQYLPLWLSCYRIRVHAEAGRDYRRVKVVAAILTRRSEGLKGPFLDEDRVIPSTGHERQQAFVHHKNEQNIKFSLSYVLANSLRTEAVGNEEPLILRSSKLVASET